MEVRLCRWSSRRHPGWWRGSSLGGIERPRCGRAAFFTEVLLLPSRVFRGAPQFRRCRAGPAPENNRVVALARSGPSERAASISFEITVVDTPWSGQRDDVLSPGPKHHRPGFHDDSAESSFRRKVARMPEARSLLRVCLRQRMGHFAGEMRGEWSFLKEIAERGRGEDQDNEKCDGLRKGMDPCVGSSTCGYGYVLASICRMRLISGEPRPRPISTPDAPLRILA